MFERDRLEGSDIRQRMIDDEPWRDRVPDAVVETIERYTASSASERSRKTTSWSGGRPRTAPAARARRED